MRVVYLKTMIVNHFQQFVLEIYQIKNPNPILKEDQAKIVTSMIGHVQLILSNSFRLIFILQLKNFQLSTVFVKGRDSFREAKAIALLMPTVADAKKIAQELRNKKYRESLQVLINYWTNWLKFSDLSHFFYNFFMNGSINISNVLPHFLIQKIELLF